MRIRFLAKGNGGTLRALVLGVNVADRRVTERVARATRVLAAVSPSHALARCVLVTTLGGRRGAG